MTAFYADILASRKIIYAYILIPCINKHVYRKIYSFVAVYICRALRPETPTTAVPPITASTHQLLVLYVGIRRRIRGPEMATRRRAWLRLSLRQEGLVRLVAEALVCRRCRGEDRTTSLPATIHWTPQCRHRRNLADFSSASATSST